MDDSNSLLVKNYKLVEVNREAAAMQPQYVGHKWAQCDVEELSHHMRTLFEDRKLATNLGQRARLYVEMNLHWADAADKILNLLDISPM